MVVLKVYSKCVKIKYKTTLCSKTTLVVLICSLITIVISYIAAYNTKGFWLKQVVYYEQPHVRYKGEYLFTALTNNLSAPILCSNFPHFYKEFKRFDKCSLIKEREIDSNKDGKFDEFNFNLTVDLPESTIISSFNLLLTLDYQLGLDCPLQMQTAILLQQAVGNSISTLHIYADLMANQKSSLICHSTADMIYNYSIINNPSDLEDYKFENIVKEFSKRNITVYLSNLYTISELGDESEFVLNLSVKYPEHKFYYKPGFWQVLKWGWIQYVAVYTITGWFTSRIKKYIFENRLVLFYEDSPMKKTA